MFFCALRVSRLQRMLVKSPAKRMSADEACAHPWMTKPRRKQNGVEPVAQAQAMSERQEEGKGGEGASAAAAPPTTESSAALDPELVRRLRNFAVG